MVVVGYPVEHSQKIRFPAPVCAILFYWHVCCYKFDGLVKVVHRFSALNREDDDGGDIAFQVRRFVASRIIALVLQGVPGIYLHSLIGTKNDIDAVLKPSRGTAFSRVAIV